MNFGESFLTSDRFASELGIVHEESGAGHATLSLRISSKHLNAHGTVHGGVIFTLADCAFAIACNTDDVPSVAINTSISYMRPVSGGILIAKASEFSKTKTLGTYSVVVLDGDERKIAQFQGMAYRIQPDTR
ncbi:PaaI family thioesterase [Methanospirillum sp. J.3.6.1-F.2.7.3]|jgi:acyl-CoA thioesterase|uniref:PaaI family thioesterase n=1 Tax=Methanospirillum purgamenti TaxID=2834276 RepID=A0A8E7B4K9_9EURY|nr:MULTISPECIES: PaaI family thioesterase [Methanospirillum]MDX8550768.1 PaaI family thioesterase [Methanospirillum hungatei]QVV90321.1 PaaI family thioesterase [Methanospirillum sp. J.3.6.1-F.2.7.3]